MSANIHPPYNPQIIPVRAEQLADEITEIAERNTTGDALREQLRFLSSVNWVQNLSDAVLVQVIAESIPETSLTIEEIYRVETWNELVELVFNEYLDDPVRDIFQQLAIEDSVHRFEIPEARGFEPAMTMSEEDEFPLNEPSYTTHTIEYKNYTAKTELGTPVGSKTVNGLAEEFADRVVRDLFDLFPERSRVDQSSPVDEAILDAVTSLKDDLYRPDSVVVGQPLDSLLNINGPATTIYGMEVNESEYIPPASVVIADTDRMGYEGIWSEGEAKTHDPWQRHTNPEIGFQPIQIGYKQLTNGIVVDPDAVRHIAV